MKQIDPIEIAKQVRNGLLYFYIMDGKIYCADMPITTSVIVGDAE